MALGMGRSALETIASSKVAGWSTLDEKSITGIAQAIAAAIDENNKAIQRALESAGVRIKT